MLVGRRSTVRRSTANALTRVAFDLEQATARRDRLIIRARDEGASLRDIADALGVSFSGVRKILSRSQPAADVA